MAGRRSPRLRRPGTSSSSGPGTKAVSSGLDISYGCSTQGWAEKRLRGWLVHPRGSSPRSGRLVAALVVILVVFMGARLTVIVVRMVFARVAHDVARTLTRAAPDHAR